jgi:sugar phosphate isomerase/epimerase
MQESIKQYMKVGIVHFMAYPQTMKGEGPCLETIAQLAGDDFWDVLEITWIKDPAARKEAIKVVADAGKKVAYGAQPRLLSQQLNLNATDTADRKRAIDEIKASIDEATEWDAAGCAFLSGKDPGDEGREEAKRLLVDSINQICQYGQSVNPGLLIVMETFDRMQCGKNALIGPTVEAVEVAAQVRQSFPGFGIMLDLSHLPMLGEKPADAIAAAGDYLVHTHFGNCVIKNPENVYYGDEHPGFGESDSENNTPELVDYLSQLIKSGYLKAGEPKTCTLEVKPAGSDTSEGIIAASKKVIEAAWAQV